MPELTPAAPGTLAATCRTCGFSDCPGANGGDCPRWPAREATDQEMTYGDLLAAQKSAALRVLEMPDA